MTVLMSTATRLPAERARRSGLPQGERGVELGRVLKVCVKNADRGAGAPRVSGACTQMVTFNTINEEYARAADEVMADGWGGLPLTLRRWFEALDRVKQIQTLVAKLEARADYTSWSNAQEIEVTNVGGVTLPSDPASRLALRLAMFRAISRDRKEMSRLVRRIFQIPGKGPADTVPQFLAAHFRPLVSELRRHIEQRLLEWDDDDDESLAPTSEPRKVTERSWSTEPVTLDPTSPQVVKSRGDFDKLLRRMGTQNDTKDPMFNQALCEVSAGRELMRGRRVRPASLGAVLDRALPWLIEHFDGLAIGLAANVLFAGLKVLFTELR